MKARDITGARTILLLGGTGFIGTNLAGELRRRGHAVVVTGHTRAANAAVDGVPPVFALSLANVDAVLSLVDRNSIDTVVHLVSSLIPSSSDEDYLADLAAVSVPTLRLARELATRGTRLVYFSSGGTIYGLSSKAQVTEEDPCEPISVYGQSKLEIESHLRFLARTRGLRCLIVRPSNPFGPHQPLHGVQGLVSVILGRVATDQALEVWGDGSSVRDYIYVDDAVASIAALIEQGVEGTTLNVGSGVGHTLLDVVQAVEQVVGRSVPMVFKPARPSDVPRLVLDMGRLSALGLHHHRPLIDGVRAYAAQLGMTDD